MYLIGVEALYKTSKKKSAQAFSKYMALHKLSAALKFMHACTLGISCNALTVTTG